MTATERLRELLDERGVEWEVDDTQVDGNGTMYRVTYAKDGYGRTWVYEEPPDCDLLISYDHDLGAEDAVEATLGPKITEDTSDGWHSFKDLYHHRALLFSVIVHNYRDMCWKSKKHHDGKELDWNFIVGIDTPWGQASYHYGMEYWDMFDCKVVEQAPYYDGYTADESVARIARLVELDAGSSTARTATIGRDAYDYYLGAKPMTEENMLAAGWERSRGACENVTTNADKNHFECSECHCIVEDAEDYYVKVYEKGNLFHGNTYRWNFCPNCGAKMVDG